MRFLLCCLLLINGALFAQELYFPPITNGNWSTTTLEEAGLCPDNEQALYDYLEATNTKAFLLLKDGKIVMERYFGDFTVITPHEWNSAGKSLMAMVVGIAADIDSLDIQAPTSRYLGTGWTDCPETEDSIRIIHQLTMTSGLSFQIGDGFCTDSDCLNCLADPGDRWSYHNAPYTLLGAVVESATGEELNDFIGTRIRRHTGMTGVYVNIGANRIFISNARSMARYGLLMLGGGSWDGNPILADTAYFNAMINSSQDLNQAYGYLWWLNGKSTYKLPGLQINIPGSILPNAPAETYAAIGKYGQIINIIPSQGLVMVRMGDDPGDGFFVPTKYNDSIWVHLNALSCTTAAEDGTDEVNELEIFPNPSDSAINIRSAQPLRRIDVFARNGRRLRSLSVNGTSARISLKGLPKGVLHLRLKARDGSVRWRRVVVR